MHVDLANILEYGANSSSSMSSNMAEGESILRSRLLPYCGRIDDDFQGFKLIAFCERDNDRDKSPYEVRGVVSRQGKILRMSCSCDDGDTGQCRHIFAMLFYCNRHDLDELHRVTEEEVEEMHSADFSPKPMSSYECVQEQEKMKKVSKLTKEQETEIKRIMFDNNFEKVLIKEEPK